MLCESGKFLDCGKDYIFMQFILIRSSRDLLLT